MRHRACRPICSTSGRSALFRCTSCSTGSICATAWTRSPTTSTSATPRPRRPPRPNWPTPTSRRCGDSGGDGVVAVHISSALSGTYGAAERTAADLDPAIRVVDSKSAAMGTGFVALAAARAAAGGADLDAVADAARSAVSRSHSFIVVHRLDNLRRSGRIGGPQAWLGTALALKPLLRIDDGKLVLAQRVRTVSNATAAMIDRVCEVVGEGPAALAVHHVVNPDGARRGGRRAGAAATRLRAGDHYPVGAGAGAACRRRSRCGMPGPGHLSLKRRLVRARGAYC